MSLLPTCLPVLLGRDRIMCLGFWELKPFPWDLLAHPSISAHYPSPSPSFDQGLGLDMRILRWSCFMTLS